MKRIKNINEMGHKEKERKILDVSFDGKHLHFDLRFSFPKERISGELIKDLLYSNNDAYHPNKEQLINGTFAIGKSPTWLDFYLVVGEDDDGNDTFSFVKRATELN